MAACLAGIWLAVGLSAVVMGVWLRPGVLPIMVGLLALGYGWLWANVAVTGRRQRWPLGRSVRRNGSLR